MAIYTDLIQESGFIEEAGEIVEATRVHMVEVTGQIVLGAALAVALNQVDPAGSSYDATYVPDVKIERRTPTLVSTDGAGNSIIRVQLDYRLQRTAENALQPLTGGASLNQVVTQVDRNDNPLEVTYGGDTYRAEANVYEVRGHFNREIVESTSDPDGWLADFINKVNGSSFRSNPDGEWLCTNGTYDVVNRATNTYRFTVEFERKPGGYVYTVAYHDAEGKIPQDVVDGDGIVDFEWHEEGNFAKFT